MKQQAIKAVETREDGKIIKYKCLHYVKCLLCIISFNNSLTGISDFHPCFTGDKIYESVCTCVLTHSVFSDSL